MSLCIFLFFVCILFGVFWAWMCRLICYISSGGSFQPLFLWLFFSVPPSPFLIPPWQACQCACWCPIFEVLLSFLNFFFCSLYKLSCSIFKFAEYFFSVSYNWILNLSNVFFVIVLVNFRISICFYYFPLFSFSLLL